MTVLKPYKSLRGYLLLALKGISLLLLSLNGYSQITYAWRNDQVTGSYNWSSNSPIYWWRGYAEVPTGNEILTFDGSSGLTSTNDLSSTSRYRISFLNTNSPASRTINGTTINTFFDFGGNPPAIFNNSGVNHTINFPIVNGNANGANRMEFNATSGNLILGSTISGNAGTRNIIGMGNSNVFFNGIISNGGATINFIKEGSGTVTFGAANTYTGTTTVSGGTLRLNAAGVLPLTNSVTINGGILQINNAAALSSTNNISLTSGTLSVGTTPTSTVNIGTLAISPGTAIDLGSGSNSFDLTIASTSGLGSGNLIINNWSPAAGKKILITDITHINNTAVLDRINFTGFGSGAKLINTNELVPKFLYYTVASGSGPFSNGSSWLNGSPSLNDGTETIYVQPGFTLTQDFSGLNLLQVVVAGTLIMDGPFTITTAATATGGITNLGNITLNTGSSIIVGSNGTFTNSGSLTMSSVASINMNTGTTWAGNGTIGSNGTINFTNGCNISSTSVLPNVTVLGNVNFNASTIGTSLEIRAGGAVTPNAPFYANGSTLIYNVSGTYNRTTEWGSNSGQGYPHHVTIKNGTTVNLNVNPISATAFGIGGNLIVENGATLSTGALTTTNFTINGNADVSGTMDATAMTGIFPDFPDIFINGDLLIGGTLSLSTTSGCDLYLSGNWNRTGTFNANNRAVYLRGGNSSITATDGQSFPFLRIEKTDSTNTITLNNAVTITSQVSFTRGVVLSSASNLFIVADGASVDAANAGSTFSFVSGPMRKIGTGAFTFPVGKIVNSTNHFRTIGIGAGAAASDFYTAEFYRASSLNRGSISAAAIGAGLQRVSYCEHWSLVKSSAAPDVAVTLSWTSQSNCTAGNYVTDLPTLVVVQYNGTQWGNTFGRTSNANASLTNNTVTWGLPTGPPTSFQYFTLGSTNAAFNPLPFTLLSFNGRNRTKDIELSFSVKGNNEQQHYLVERSVDGRNFTQLTKIAATQNSTADYTTLDEQPVNGWNYYRLTAVDVTGNKKQSQIIRVWFGNRIGKPAIYPNPVQGSQVQLFTGGLAKGNYNLQIVGVDGKIMLSRYWQFDGVQPLYTLPVPQLPAGMYYLVLSGENQPPVQLKFIK